MKDDEFIELINKEISGEITPRERDELHQYLRKRPEAQRVYRQLHKTSELLSEIGDIEPPDHLKRHIMNSLDFSLYQGKQERPVLEFFRGVRRLSLRPRFAYAFATGVAVGLILYAVYLGDPFGRYSPDLGDLYATIGMTKDASLETVERWRVDSPEVQGWVNLSRFADLFILEFSLNSTQQFEVRLTYDPAQASFDGLRPGVDGTSVLEVGEGYVSTSGSGDSKFNLSFMKTTASPLPVELELLMSGKPFRSHRFEVGPQDDGNKTNFFDRDL